MKNSIIKVMKQNQIITMIYISKSGAITQRRVKILKLTNNTFTAYCYIRRAKRTFYVDNVLAINPVTYEKKKVY
ncbi:transcriptional regulator [Lysinibacillus irui]|uniref:Transcriptional regulator n=1 Tax=Lysinibacillus irui TaxID=2998077 RepID=A0AAJ5RQJ8_9BACI|nr:transcriptional regulator [Lysinibacillus irui]WDV09246.1 transcriptional regulator [Lysinibacillus irui]